MSRADVVVIDMTPPMSYGCAMCQHEGDWRHAVPYYERPVHEGESEGGYRGVCPPCYEHWLAWDEGRVDDVRRLAAQRAEFRLMEGG